MQGLVIVSFHPCANTGRMPKGRAMTEERTEDEASAIRGRIVELGIEHRDLDDIIARLTAEAYPDELQLRRLKKRKLWLKDEIARLQMLLTPDIPA